MRFVKALQGGKIANTAYITAFEATVAALPVSSTSKRAALAIGKAMDINATGRGNTTTIRTRSDADVDSRVEAAGRAALKTALDTRYRNSLRHMVQKCISRITANAVNSRARAWLLARLGELDTLLITANLDDDDAVIEYITRYINAQADSADKTAALDWIATARSGHPNIAWALVHAIGAE